MTQVQTATSGGWSQGFPSGEYSSQEDTILFNRHAFSENRNDFHPQILVVVCNAYKNISHFASQPGRDTNSLG